MSNNKMPDPRTILVQASHILYHHGILDGFGHISARDPLRPGTFFQTGLAAALITKPEDFVTYYVDDGSIVQLDDELDRPSQKTRERDPRISPYSEHYIHAAIYARFPDVMAVVHSHARDVLPFTVIEPPNQSLPAVIHTAGFLGRGPPVWDIADAYGPQHESSKRHLLVNDYELGASLAAAAVHKGNIPPNYRQPTSKTPWHRVVLQRGHGFVALGFTIQEAVYNAVYTVENAKVLSQALQLCGNKMKDVHCLSLNEIEACTTMDRDCLQKVWPLWAREAEQNPFWK